MTLENSKGYGLKERVQSLQDVSRSRLNGPTPHQVRMHAATVKRLLQQHQGVCHTGTCNRRSASQQFCHQCQVASIKNQLTGSGASKLGLNTGARPLSERSSEMQGVVLDSAMPDCGLSATDPVS